MLFWGGYAQLGYGGNIRHMAYIWELCAISPQRALALGAAHRAQQEEPKTECRRKKYEIRRMGQKQSYSFQVESP